jgi:ubiquinone/menaquinone biosynthesis C-methylase UbiE
MEPLERKFLGGIRKQIVRQAKGIVLEIGAGTGLNFPYYETAERVVAIEPDRLMRQRANRRAHLARVPIEVFDDRAEELPFPDNTFDRVIGTLVLCTIPDPLRALQEMRRVCKPNGELLFFEHVRMAHPVLGRMQDWMTPAWKSLCDGCHLNRNTLDLIKQSGLRVRRVEGFAKDLFLLIEAVNEKTEP